MLKKEIKNLFLKTAFLFTSTNNDAWKTVGSESDHIEELHFFVFLCNIRFWYMPSMPRASKMCWLIDCPVLNFRKPSWLNHTCTRSQCSFQHTFCRNILTAKHILSYGINALTIVRVPFHLKHVVLSLFMCKQKVVYREEMLQ